MQLLDTKAEEEMVEVEVTEEVVKKDSVALFVHMVWNFARLEKDYLPPKPKKRPADKATHVRLSDS